VLLTEALLALLVAQNPGTSVDEIRTQTRILLQSMCGEQCDVIDVRVKEKKEAPSGAPAPGFDDAPRARVVPSEVGLTLLFDSKLPKPYRDFVSDRVKQRIGELGLPVLITQNVQAFPAPPPEPVAPVPPVPPPPPPQAPMIIQQPPPAPPPALPPPAKADLGEAFWLKLIEALPLLLGFLMLGWLVMKTLQRLENLGQRPARDDEEEEEDTRTITPELIEEPSEKKVAQVMPPPTSGELSAELSRFRGSTRRIFHRLLLAGDHDTVAKSVALLGDFIVQDLTHDPALKRALAGAGVKTAEILRSPITDDEKTDLLRTVHAELVADRVAHRAEDVRREFEALLGWSPESFASLLGRLDQRLIVVLLRHAPGHLTESFLKGLDPDARAKIVKRLLGDPPAEPEEIEVLGDHIETQAQAALVGGYEADHIVEILESLPADEQDRVVSDLETTRPDFVRRNLGVLPVESALLRVPEQALGAAWSRVPFEDWLAYLRVAPEAIRVRALASCPARLRQNLTDELALRVAGDPARATQARRRIVEAALTAAPALGGGASLEANVVQRKEP
jgi:flagellar motor switch protein FliG